MEVKMLKEINYLTRLIEQHKKQVTETLKDINCASNCPVPDISKVVNKDNINLNNKSQSSNQISQQGSNKCIYVKPLPMITNVHVNPNFKCQNPIIHINPKVQMKPLIHVNPKLVKNITSTNKHIESTTINLKSNSECNVEHEALKKSKTSIKPLVHVNPKIMNDITSLNQKIEANYMGETSNPKANFKNSVHINPKLMSKLSSAKESKITNKKNILDNSRSICSRLKFVKKVDTLKVTMKKVNTPNVWIRSQKKLTKVKRVSKGSIGVSQICSYKAKKNSLSPFKKNRIVTNTSQTPKNMITNNNVLVSQNKNLNSTKLHNSKLKNNKYKIDRTVPHITENKNNTDSTVKNTVDKTMELITIGGVVYKSSRNRLVRRSYSIKKKRFTSTRNDKFIVTTNGKALRRLKTSKEILQQVNTSKNSDKKSISNIPLKVNYKNNISNKVKQRSIQILRNKMRKNNQPCLLFQRFGYCANQKKGTCPKLHDKKQVSLCKKFLQGKCLLDLCPLSHDVGPEKMPTCKYFLEGCCTREGCPYLHVKVSSNTPICIEFLQGYCAKGNECKRRHENLCPEYDKSEKCSKGKYCPYPHKTHAHTHTVQQTDKYLKRKQNISKNQNTCIMENNTMLSNPESRLRYYERTDSVKDIDKTRKNIMKKLKMMKDINFEIQTGSPSVINIELKTNSSEMEENDQSSVISNNKISRRSPIGSLPAFIPIN